jgi:hypothetical protein
MNGTALSSNWNEPSKKIEPQVLSTGEYDEIRPVANIRELEAVYRLTHECYVAKSYVQHQPNGLLLHYPEFDVVPETSVLVAIHAGEVIGSISFTVSRTEGLTIGQDFREECLQMEKEGRVLCAIWRLVVKEAHRGSRQVLLGLISEATRRLLMSPMNSFLLVVNPKHTRVYKRLLNMREVGSKGITEGLHNAPAVLLRGDRETLPSEWRLANFAVGSHTPMGLLSLESFLKPAANSD